MTKATSVLVIRNGLLAQDIQGYTEEQELIKSAFHRDARAFLKSLAGALCLSRGEYEIRSNRAGPAVSGEVLLLSDSLYVQLGESSIQPGVSVLFRSCAGRKDFSGGPNHWASILKLRDPAQQATFLAECRSLMGERNRAGNVAA